MNTTQHYWCFFFLVFFFVFFFNAVAQSRTVGGVSRAIISRFSVYTVAPEVSYLSTFSGSRRAKCTGLSGFIVTPGSASASATDDDERDGPRAVSGRPEIRFDDTLKYMDTRSCTRERFVTNKNVCICGNRENLCAAWNRVSTHVYR